MKSRQSRECWVATVQGFPTLPFLGQRHSFSHTTGLCICLSLWMHMASRLFKSQFNLLLLCEVFSKSSRNLGCSFSSVPLAPYTHPPSVPRLSSDPLSLSEPSSRLSQKVSFTPDFSGFQVYILNISTQMFNGHVQINTPNTVVPNLSK